MYEKVGVKIQAAAKIFGIIGIIASLIYGFLFGFGEENILAGLIIVAIGSICFYFYSLLLYGFGILVEHFDYT